MNIKDWVSGSKNYKRMFFLDKKNQKRILARVSVSETRPCEKAENE